MNEAPIRPLHWFERENLKSRFVTEGSMQSGDIAMMLPDGRLFLVGSGGNFYDPSPWERFKAWWR